MDWWGKSWLALWIMQNKMREEREKKYGCQDPMLMRYKKWGKMKGRNGNV